MYLVGLVARSSRKLSHVFSLMAYREVQQVSKSSRVVQSTSFLEESQISEALSRRHHEDMCSCFQEMQQEEHSDDIQPQRRSDEAIPSRGFFSALFPPVSLACRRRLQALQRRSGHAISSACMSGLLGSCALCCDSGGRHGFLSVLLGSYSFPAFRPNTWIVWPRSALTKTARGREA